MAWGEAESQSIVEAYAIYRALLRWGTSLKKSVVLVKGDSSVALHMLKMLSSPSQVGASPHIGSSQRGDRRLSRMHDRGPKTETTRRAEGRRGRNHRMPALRAGQFAMTK